MEVQSFVSLDDNQTEESVMESISIVSIPFKKIQPPPIYKRRDKSKFGLEPKQNEELMAHVDAPITQSQFNTPEKLDKT